MSNVALNRSGRHRCVVDHLFFLHALDEVIEVSHVVEIAMITQEFGLVYEQFLSTLFV